MRNIDFDAVVNKLDELTVQVRRVAFALEANVIFRKAEARKGVYYMEGATVLAELTECGVCGCALVVRGVSSCPVCNATI